MSYLSVSPVGAEGKRIEDFVGRPKGHSPKTWGDVCSFAEAKLGFRVDSKQRELLEAESRRVILNCTRQWGKSSVTALKAVHAALTTKEATVIVMSPSERQSGEFLRKVKRFLAKAGLAKLPTDQVNELSVVLPNESRVIALPGVEATMRGFSAVDLLIIDEAARVSQEQYYAAGPMLAVKNGALWLLSTPFGAQGFFWREWVQGGEEWLRVEVKASECERISAAFLESERRRMGADWFRQEYCCEFVSAEGQAIRAEWLEEAMVRDERELEFS